MRHSLVWALILVSAATSAGTADGAEPTFSKDVAPLVMKHCVKCHRPGEVAPFSLLTFGDVAKRADLVLEVVARQAMPPWKPVAGHGDFANGRRLSGAEIGVIRRWVESGGKEGSAADLPKPPEFADGWRLGKPDLV